VKEEVVPPVSQSEADIDEVESIVVPSAVAAVSDVHCVTVSAADDDVTLPSSVVSTSDDRHSSAASTQDDLDSFLRQLSRMSCKSDVDGSAVDILTEFDEVISQLDTKSAEDFDSQKTITPDDDHSAFPDFPDNVQPEIETETSVVAERKLLGNTELEIAPETATNVTGITQVVSVSAGTDTAVSLNGTCGSEAEGENMPLASAADKDDDDSAVPQHSKTDPFSSLLYCKYEPPYQPTVGTRSVEFYL